MKIHFTFGVLIAGLAAVVLCTTACGPREEPRPETPQVDPPPALPAAPPHLPDPEAPHVPEPEIDVEPQPEPELRVEAPEPAFIRTVDDAEWGPCPDFMPAGCGLAVLQGDPEAHNADVFFRLAGGTTVENHWHTSAERMILVAGEMQVDYEGQDPVVLTPGTYAYGPAGLPHVTHCIGDEDCILFIAFEEPVDAFPVEASR